MFLPPGIKITIQGILFDLLVSLPECHCLVFIDRFLRRFSFTLNFQHPENADSDSEAEEEKIEELESKLRDHDPDFQKYVHAAGSIYTCAYLLNKKYCLKKVNC